MSDDETDYELLELLRRSLGIKNKPKDEITSNTGVLEDAEYIYNNAVDVAIDMWATKSAARRIWKTIQERGYSMQAWSEHELHPKLDGDLSEIEMVNFVFTMDLLNFSFWSELSEQDRFQVDFNGKRWTGYMSLVACLQRAIREGIPVTTPRFWRSPLCTDETVKHVFRSATNEQIPLLEERIAVLREAGQVLQEFDEAVSYSAYGDGSVSVDEAEHNAIMEQSEPVLDPGRALSNPIHQPPHASVLHGHDPESQADPSTPETSVGQAANNDEDVPPAEEGFGKNEDREGLNPLTTTNNPNLSNFSSSTDRSVGQLISKADRSAGKLVNLLVKNFSSFRDKCSYEGRTVRFLKRAQIFVADLHAACNGQGLGAFTDIDGLTMFADYRVPQILHRFGVLSYCPALQARIQDKLRVEHRGSWEVQIRGCSIWATELLRREICRQPGAESVNAVLIDFLLYDLAKELEFSKVQMCLHEAA